MSDNETPRPWYREPYFWMVVGIPAAAIVWSAFLLSVALNHQISMVSDDYYDEGMGINRELSRDIEAARLGMSAELHFREDNTLEIQLSSDEDRDWSELKVELLHPTLGDRDQELTAQSAGDNRYRVQVEQLIHGRWYLDVRDADNQWRLKGETVLPQDEPITLRPQRDAPAT